MYHVNALNLSLTFYTDYCTNTARCTCTVHLCTHLNRTGHVHSGALREPASYALRVLWTVEGTYSGQCAYHVHCTGNVHSAPVSSLASFTALAQCPVCSYQAHTAHPSWIVWCRDCVYRKFNEHRWVHWQHIHYMCSIVCTNPESKCSALCTAPADPEVKIALLEELVRIYSAPSVHHVRKPCISVCKNCCKPPFSRTAMPAGTNNCVRGTLLGPKTADCSTFSVHLCATLSTYRTSSEEVMDQLQPMWFLSRIGQVASPQVLASQRSAEIDWYNT